jgi:hypothetical protein
LQQIDGEKVSSARMPGATIIGHGDSIAEKAIRRNALRLLSPYGESRADQNVGCQYPRRGMPNGYALPIRTAKRIAPDVSI